MREQISELMRQGAWQAIREAVPPCLHAYTGHDRAHLHAALSTAYFHTAHDPLDYREALRHAHACRLHAEPNSPLQLWTLHKIAGLSVTVGQYRDAQRYATRFLACAHLSPALAPYVPYALRDLAAAHFRYRRYAAAIALRRKALALFQAQGEIDEAIRTACNLVWACARAGRLAEARTALPDAVPQHLEHLRLGAECALLTAERHYDEAWRSGRAAVDAARALHDFIDAADVSILLMRVARHRREAKRARELRDRAVRLCNRQGHDAALLLAVKSIGNGGESQNESPSLSASERCGASLTTGIG